MPNTQDRQIDMVAVFLCDSDLDREGRRAQLDALCQVSDGTDPNLCLAKLTAGEAVVSSVRAQQTRAVLDARALGVTWEQIGTALGITKQAAQQRFRSLA